MTPPNFMLYDHTTMKRSTIMFNVAAVAVCLAISLAMVDLMRHKAQAHKPVIITYRPTLAATEAP